MDKPVPLIECIGDSHVCFFLGRDYIGACHPRTRSRFPFFRVHTVGPALAYNLCETGTTTGGRERIFKVLDKAEPGSHVLLAFGEIDCRAHLLLQARKRDIAVDSVVENCVERYFSVVKEIGELGFRPIVYNAPPSTYRRPSWDPNVEKSFPSYGSCRERNHVTRLFNESLRRRCREAAFLFLENFDFIVNLRGISRRRYFLDRIHLNQRAMPQTLERLRALLPDHTLAEPPGWRREVSLSYLGFKVK